MTEGYCINTITSVYLIEQKSNTPILLNIFLIGLLCFISTTAKRKAFGRIH